MLAISHELCVAAEDIIKDCLSIRKAERNLAGLDGFPPSAAILVARMPVALSCLMTLE